MYPACLNRKYLCEILLPLWGQKENKFYKNESLSGASELDGRIRYKIKTKNVHFYIEIGNS